MTDETQRVTEAYEAVKDSDKHDWQRVVYEVPYGEGWQDAEGYVVEADVAGEPVLRVVSEDEVESIPFRRVIRVHIQCDDD